MDEFVFTRALDGRRILTRVALPRPVGSFGSDVSRYQSIVQQESALLRCIAAERAARKARSRAADSAAAVCAATSRAAASQSLASRAAALPAHGQLRLDEEFLNLQQVRACTAGRPLSAKELRLSQSLCTLGRSRAASRAFVTSVSERAV